ncbi:Pex12 amino terminal region-domain-containing protein [Ochromonadaceae sp. CCMP2298]|nr:Pex12 amino terminal region-domain-containing protein [Ochromonadaceae sp. CCMP2298]
MQTEILLSSIDEQGSRPSFFEILIMDRMEKTIKPALRHVAMFIAERYNVDFLLEQFDTLYTALLAIAQWRFMSRTGSSVMESMYGFQRKSDGTGGLWGVGSGGAAGSAISARQRVLSVYVMVLLPHALESLRAIFEIIRARSESQPQSQPPNPERASDNGPPPLVRTPALSFRVARALGAAVRCSVERLAYAYPYLELTGELSVAAFQLLFLCNQTPYHHPVFALLGMTLEKTGLRGGRAQTVPPGTAGTGAVGVGVSLPVAVVLAVVLCVKAAEYLRNDESLTASHLTTRLTSRTALPPPPTPVKVGRGCVVPDPSLCALCRQPRANPTASTGGYVFCFMCLLPFVREHGRCPVTRVPCNERDIIRLYEGASLS